MRASDTSRSRDALPDPARSHRIARARGARNRRNRDLRSARGRVRLPRRHRQPRRLHGPLHVRLPARACDVRRAGAAARFRLENPGPKQWAEVQFVAFERPRRIVEEGKSGRFLRNKFWTVWELSPEGKATRVELTFWTEPATRWDSFKEALGARSWVKRQNRTALARLQKAFEEPPKSRWRARPWPGSSRRLCPASATIRAGNGSRPRDRLPRPMGLRRVLLALACAATAASFSGCFLEEEKEEGEPLREGLAVSVGGIEYTVYITRELNPSLAGRPRLLAGRGGEAGLRPLRRLHPGVQPQRETRTTTSKTTRTRRPTTSWSWTRRATSTSRSRPRRRTSSTTTRRSRAGSVHPGGGQPRPARPDRRRDAAVPVPARGGREPAARARDPRRAAKRGASSSTSSRRRRPAGRPAPPALPSHRRRRSSPAAPPPRSSAS